MITLLALSYTYMVWLFTAYNPMPHLDPFLVVVIIPEAIIEILFIICISSVIETIFKGLNKDK